MEPVKSSALEAVEYRKENKLLIIKFKTGSVFVYYDVPLKVYMGLMAAKSKGSYFNRHIRGYYRNKRL